MPLLPSKFARPIQRVRRLRLLSLEDRTVPAVATWSGAGSTNFWLDRTNWVGNNGPLPGDDLVFPAGALQLSNTNDFKAGTPFASLTVSSGYTLNGNDVNLTAQLRINGDFVANGTSTINLAIRGTAAAVIDFPANAGTLILTPQNVGGNNYDGGTTITDGTLQGTALGLVGNFVNNSNLVFDQNAPGSFFGSISGPGQVVKRGDGTLVFENNSVNLTYSGPTIVEAGILQLGSVSGTYDGDIIPDTSAVVVTAPAVFDTAGYSDVIGSLAGDGAAIMNGPGGGATLTTGADNSTTVFAGMFQLGAPPIANSQVIKIGQGTFTISGQNFATPSTGVVQSAGAMVITGSAFVTVTLDGGLLVGTGAVSAVVARKGGQFSPGIGTGRFTVGIGSASPGAGPSFFNAATNFTSELEGTNAGVNYDQLAIVGNGSLNVGGAVLQLLPRFVAAKGDVFNLIVAPPGRIAGTFANLPEGATVNAGGQQFVISYVAAPTPNQQAVQLRALGPPVPPPSPTRLLAVGAGAGGSPIVNVYNADGSARFSFLAYDAGFQGGVRVATGDIDGDRIDDIITAPGVNGGPHIKIYSGRNANLLLEFNAYSPAFTGGVFVAAGDINGDGFAEVITGAGSCGGPHVKVFAFPQRVAVVREFFAYDPAFTGGVRVAAGDVNGDGLADIVTGAGPCGGPHVQVFSGRDNSRLQSFFAYDPAYSGGVFVAAGDVTGDGRAEVITGTDVTGEPQVRIFNNAALASNFLAYESAFLGGVRVASSDLTGDGRAEIITGAGPNGGSRIRVLSGPNGNPVREFSAFDPQFTGSVYVG